MPRSDRRQAAPYYSAERAIQEDVAAQGVLAAVDRAAWGREVKMHAVARAFAVLVALSRKG